MALKTTKQKFSERATFVLALICGFGFLLCICSLVYVQLIKGNEFRELAAAGQLKDTFVSAERGVIYDANMTPLAESSSAKTIFILPNLINENPAVEKAVSKGLSEILDVSEESVLALCKRTNSGYEKVKTKVSFETANEVQKLREEYVVVKDTEGKDKKLYLSNYIGIDPDVCRYYSNPYLASSVLGFTGVDDIGRYGIELFYDSTLTGVPGRVITAQNGGSNAQSMPIEYKNVYDAQQGNSLVLTIDEHIQSYLENALQQTYINTRCDNVLGILMDVDTGAILGMGSRGAGYYNMSDASEIADDRIRTNLESLPEEERQSATLSAQYRQWKNICISETYEPGSVFKVFTASALLEEGVCTADETYTCVGSVEAGGREYMCHRHSGHGTQDMRAALMNSCNPFFITRGVRLGASRFTKYLEAFGFRYKTGIDLPGEGESVLHDFDKFSVSNVASCAFGQTFNVTPIQMITALSCVANGGKLMQPYVVAKTLDADGNIIHETKPTVRRQVISEKTSAAVRDMMESVVKTGTGKNAYVAGYRVAGKTGTSEDIGQGGNSHYWASFGCFAPANNPKVAMLIVIDNPEGAHGGGAIAAPVASEVLSSVLPYLNVELQYTQKETESLEVTTKSVVGIPVAEAKSTLSTDGFRVVVKGSGDVVVSQIPTGGQSIPKGGTIILYTTEQSKKERLSMPDLSGLTIRQATEVALGAGINIKIVGNTLLENEMFAYKQSVKPGDPVEYGAIVTVLFKSNMGISDSQR